MVDGRVEHANLPVAEEFGVLVEEGGLPAPALAEEEEKRLPVVAPLDVVEGAA